MPACRAALGVLTALVAAFAVLMAVSASTASATSRPPVIRSDSVSPRVFDPLVRDGFRDAALFSFHTSQRGTARILIRTRGGRIVRTVQLGDVKSGAHTWRWYGRNRAGRTLARGRYTIVLVVTTVKAAHTATGTEMQRANHVTRRTVSIESSKLTEQEVVHAALARTGKPYRWGATGPGAFDCNGLTRWSYAKAGITLPRTSEQQFDRGRHISRWAVHAGDLVFFDTDGPGATHVGIAVSSTAFVSATDHGVRTTTLGGSYWGAHYLGARRIVRQLPR